MSKRLYPHKRVRYWYAYDIEDICALFSDVKLHPQTVRKWIKNGLKTIGTGNPVLVYGCNLIAYLQKNNNANKCKTAFGEMYCMGCQDARPIFQSKIAVEQKAKFLQAQAICRKCKKHMFKNYKLSDFPVLRKKFALVDVSELYDFEAPTDMTHFHAQEQNTKSEPALGEQYGELF